MNRSQMKSLVKIDISRSSAIIKTSMQLRTTKTSYLLYARKSSESEDRQVQSIDSQVKRLTELALNLNLTIEKLYTESKSAKRPNSRPVFETVMKAIENGQADGILCWQINRLSRNPIDSARIQWLLQQGILKSIQTIDREYRPDDNALLLSVESGIANQYIIDLSKNVKRGLLSKLEKGWLPNLAPSGYLNDRGNQTIVKDPQRFPLIRKMWDLMLTGSYTPPQILKKANTEWGFQTRKFKRIGGKALSRSGIYRIFTNLFYAGIIEHHSRQYEGKHEPMISLSEYDRVQRLLGRKGRSRPKKHAFAFTGFIRCGECGCLYTAETKTKYIKSTGEIRSYTYYHCTRKRKDVNCLERKNIREEDLERMIEDELGKCTILPEFRDWALEVLRQTHDKEVEERSKIHEMRSQTLLERQKQLDNLVGMRYRELITDEEYITERTRLQNELVQLKTQLRETENRADEWLQLTEKAFDFATYAREAFITGDLETKKAILMALGQNPMLKDGKLSIEANSWLQPIKTDYPPLEVRYRRLEPTESRLNKEQNEALTSLRVDWRGVVDDVRTTIEALGSTVYIPKLPQPTPQTALIAA